MERSPRYCCTFRRTVAQGWVWDRAIWDRAVWQRPQTTVRHPEHKVWPYLLRDLAIERPTQAWCADITCIPMRRGFLYLVAVRDWATRKALSWRPSNTMGVAFCIAAV